MRGANCCISTIAPLFEIHQNLILFCIVKHRRMSQKDAEESQDKAGEEGDGEEPRE